MWSVELTGSECRRGGRGGVPGVYAAIGMQYIGRKFLMNKSCMNIGDDVQRGMALEAKHQPWQKARARREARNRRRGTVKRRLHQTRHLTIGLHRSHLYKRSHRA